ncbi:hypothetical protein Salat_1653100 [Sesamum alatum]|uniref:Uncharacterized protein n=1 Tax=Sesamum alatum TaxID=300844 RepID=A0AAE2CJM1_9LAMI|nr:hypothetical protein Salat_1653100 [Sesamum alatum]
MVEVRDRNTFRKRRIDDGKVRLERRSRRKLGGFWAKLATSDFECRRITLPMKTRAGWEWRSVGGGAGGGARGRRPRMRLREVFEGEASYEAARGLRGGGLVRGGERPSRWGSCFMRMVKGGLVNLCSWMRS